MSKQHALYHEVMWTDERRELVHCDCPRGLPLSSMMCPLTQKHGFVRENVMNKWPDDPKLFPCGGFVEKDVKYIHYEEFVYLTLIDAAEMSGIEKGMRIAAHIIANMNHMSAKWETKQILDRIPHV
jgi:hypothetical protein